MFQARINRRNNHAVEMRNAKRSVVLPPPPKVTLPSVNHPGSTNTETSSSALPSGFSSRIPTTLQQVFLSSNRGNNVDKPPPMKVANRMFITFWSKAFASSSSSSSRTSKTETPPVERKSSPVESASAPETPTPQPVVTTEMSPQEYLDQMLQSRGYPTTHYKTLSTAYYNKPTPLQQASYSRYIIDTIKAHDAKKFQQIMMSGISTNPCNGFGESTLHMVCRRGDATLLQILLSDDVKVELHVADDYGRTPMHDACWASEMAKDVLNMILQENTTENIHMFYMEDARGSLPLSYVHKTQYAEWIQYIDSVKDQYWPVVIATAQKSPTTMNHSLLVRQPPHTRPIPDPVNALSIELATMVANGRLEPHEASVIKRNGTYLGADDATERMVDEDSDDDDDDSDDDDDDDDSDYDSDEEEEDSEGDDVDMIQEMSAILYKQ